MYPLVSICTPTFNRVHFIKPMIDMVKNQDYPLDRVEWLIADDGTDSVEHLFQSIDFVKVKYFKIEQHKTLGFKRNFLNSKCEGDFIVYMDDDDYYPRDRISYGVSILLSASPNFLIAGNSEMHIYYHHINKIFKCGPYALNHATAATFIFRKELLKQTQFNEESLVGEEKYFLKNYTIPMLQLNSFKTILVIAHSHNSFDKKKLLDDPDKYLMTETPYKLTDFITTDSFPYIPFYTKDLHLLLVYYLPGSIICKPRILSHITELEKSRTEKENKINTYKSATSVMQQTTIKEYEDKLQHKSILIQKLIRELKELREELNQHDLKLKETKDTIEELKFTKIREELKELVETREELDNMKGIRDELNETRNELDNMKGIRYELNKTRNELEKTQEVLKETQDDLEAMSWTE